MNYKIYFQSGYSPSDISNDNIDINIILENGKILFCTLFTISNIEMLMNNGNENHFWAANMIIVKNIEKKTIRNAIGEIVSSEYFLSALEEIGSLEKGYFNSVRSFDEIEDMCQFIH